MPIPITEAELSELQKVNPSLAQKISLSIIEEAKSLAQKPASKNGRYSSGANTPYYNLKTAERCAIVLNALKNDRAHDLIIPERMLGRTVASAQQYYHQGFNFIRDNSGEFDKEFQNIMPYIKIRKHEKGLQFHWIAEIEEEFSPEGFIKVATVKDNPKESVEDKLPVFNWRSKIEDFKISSSIGDKIEITPLCLSDDDMLEARELLSEPQGTFVFAVREEMITIRRIN